MKSLDHSLAIAALALSIPAACLASDYTCSAFNMKNANDATPLTKISFDDSKNDGKTLPPPAGVPDALILLTKDVNIRGMSITVLYGPASPTREIRMAGGEGPLTLTDNRLEVQCVPVNWRP